MKKTLEQENKELHDHREKLMAGYKHKEAQLERITAERDQLLLDREINEGTRKALKIKEAELLEQIEKSEHVIEMLKAQISRENTK